MPDISQEAGLLGLFIASFLSATLLPGGSELALLAVLQSADAVVLPIAVATLGNTLGGATSYGLGRLLPNRTQARALTWVRRYGVAALLLSWLPLLGDALCVAAGWLRLNPWLSLLAIGAGKLARYVALAGGWVWLTACLAPA